jgi:hypothetical protein
LKGKIVKDSNSPVRASAHTLSPAPTSTPIEAASAVFGERPKDVLFHIDIATDALSWCEAVFLAIKALHEQGDSVHIKHLANVGYYVAESIGANMEGSREKMMACISAAQAQEGGAA